MSPALRITICPDTVLLFEPRINYPALRVTRIHFHLKINDFLSFSLTFSMKFIENQIFSIFSIFSKNVQNFVTAKDLAIIYRPRRYLAQNHRWNLLYPEIKSDRNLNGWSRVKNSHLHSKGPDLLPALRITICPDTVLLFEPRINYPALRVTTIEYFSKLSDFYDIVLNFQ